MVLSTSQSETSNQGMPESELTVAGCERMGQILSLVSCSNFPVSKKWEVKGNEGASRVPGSLKSESPPPDFLSMVPFPVYEEVSGIRHGVSLRCTA